MLHTNYTLRFLVMQRFRKMLYKIQYKHSGIKGNKNNVQMYKCVVAHGVRMVESEQGYAALPEDLAVSKVIPAKKLHHGEPHSRVHVIRIKDVGRKEDEDGGDEQVILLKETNQLSV